jgi:quercetin dioxygenase-like cupin family protein
MPKMSKQTATPNSEGPGTEWAGELDGYSASIVQVKGDADLTELLRGLPGDRCPSPHWGYVLSGRMWFRSDRGEESFGPGDAFYVAPGHTSGADDGSEFVVFSPSEIIAEVNAHMGRRAQELFGH